MQILWIDLNASYAHASLALPSIHAQVQSDDWAWSVVSATTEGAHRPILEEALRIQPRLVVATAWLFNHRSLQEILSRLKALLPNCFILLGGPEFLGPNEAYLRQHTYIDALFRGEGEEIFPQYLNRWPQDHGRSALPGFCYLDDEGRYHDHGQAKVQDFAALRPPESSPFFPWNKPFVQIETARGCLNHCSFCVSGHDAPLRELPLDSLRERIEQLCQRGVREIRLLDRTFNIRLARAAKLLQLFGEFAGRLRFHLEVHPGWLSPLLRTCLQEAPEGLLHIEAGVQSLHNEVLQASGRKGDVQSCLDGLRFLCACPNFETHVDLIAGLPQYSLAQLKVDVTSLMALAPAEIQLELLKVLPGTPFRLQAAQLGLCYAPLPPYEILSTPAASVQDLGQAQALSRLLDHWYNGHTDWRIPFACAVVQEPQFLEDFLQEMSAKELLFQPLSMETRGLLLYEFCQSCYPQQLTAVRLAWICGGHSLKKAPAQALQPWKQPPSSSPIKYYHLESPSGPYWFGFDSRLQQRQPVCVLRTPPEIKSGDRHLAAP